MSIIPPKAESSLVSKSALGLQRCRSMSDIGRTRLNLTDSEIILRSNRAIWTFLLEHSRKAVEKQNKKEEVRFVVAFSTKSEALAQNLPIVLL